MKTGWIITKLLDGGGWDAGDNDRIENNLGVNTKDFTLCDPETKRKFQVRDDDNIPYAEGWMWGNWHGFEPLDDWAMPSLGCTQIYIYEKEGWEQV